jgi:chlorobactene glucosyltransferase
MSTIFWLAASTLGLAFSWWVTWWVHHHASMDVVVRSALPDENWPLLSVIIPARNEERNIAACVGALLAQDYPHYEIIVIDDRSEDGTGQILEGLARQDRRLRVIRGVELPGGWAGKPHALWQGAAQARGDWLCFIDADTFAEPGLLSAAYAMAAQTGADLFTILTSQELGSFWEKVILPLVFTALSVGFSPRRVNDPRRPDAIANGQFLLFRRRAYQAIGGHQAVKASIVEDKDLATLIKRAGLCLVVADGRSVARTRMYTGFGEIWEGWTKNIFLGLRDRPSLLALGAAGALLLLAGALVLPGWLAGGAIWLAAGGGWSAALTLAEACLAWAYLLALRAQVSRAIGISAWYALTLPLGSLIFAAMMAVSAFRVLSGKGVVWKGRVYR